MKVLYSSASPYARKVWITLWETGLIDQVEMEIAAPWIPETTVGQENPLGKIPVLILDDGTHLYDSPVICEYLDTCHDGQKLFPASGIARWEALRLQALGDGIMDAAVAARLEVMFHEEAVRSTDWIIRQKAAMGRAVDALEAGADDLAKSYTIGHVSVLCALNYLDFRLPDERWREGHSRLSAWYERESRRQSFQKTIPH